MYKSQFIELIVTSDPEGWFFPLTNEGLRKLQTLLSNPIKNKIYVDLDLEILYFFGDIIEELSPFDLTKEQHKMFVNFVEVIESFNQSMLKVHYKEHTITKTPHKLSVIRQCFNNFYKTSASCYVIRGPVYNIWNLLLGCTSLDQCKEEINQALEGVKA